MEGNELRFITEQLQRGVRAIMEAQRRIAGQHASGDSQTTPGRAQMLMEALSESRFTVAQQGGGVIATSTVPLAMRFVDMKRHGNWQIYNRQVWGILYGDTLHTIKYEYRDWLREHISDSLNNLNR